MAQWIDDIKQTVFRVEGGDPWYGGPTLAQAVADVDATAAVFRIGGRGRCIWEIVLHAAYWRREVAHALSGGRIDRLAREPDNWPSLPARADEAAWRQDRQLLDESERAFLDALDRFPAQDWSKFSEGGGTWTLGQLALGLVAHDAYHIGQVVLLKRAATPAQPRD